MIYFIIKGFYFTQSFISFLFQVKTVSSSASPTPGSCLASKAKQGDPTLVRTTSTISSGLQTTRSNKCSTPREVKTTKTLALMPIDNHERNTKILQETDKQLDNTSYNQILHLSNKPKMIKATFQIGDFLQQAIK